jgi:N6-L-threonylcarbamoyladenine synthase
MFSKIASIFHPPMTSTPSLILALESSCDETAASVVRDGRVILSNVIATQHKLHVAYGGVVPEIASRAHIEKILPVIDQAVKIAGVTFDDLDAIAVGNRPGLIGSLLIAVSAAKSLAWSLGKPLIGVDHVQAHLYAADLVTDPALATNTPVYPALGLVVSGGHTCLYRVTSPLALTKLGSTIDDAVGEAYDKAAVILNAGYPGGPMLDKLAQTGDAQAVDPLPISLLDRDSLDFSYSGLKTALLYRVRGNPVGKGKEVTFERSAADLTTENKANLAAAFQEAAIGAVMKKVRRALDQMASQGNTPGRILVGGGVSANSELRKQMLALGEELGLAVCLPPMAVCLDNAAMLAGLAHHRFIEQDFDDLDLPVIATSAM